MGLLFWGGGTPTFWLGLLLFTKRESRTPTFKILVRTLNAYMYIYIYMYVCVCVCVINSEILTTYIHTSPLYIS